MNRRPFITCALTGGSDTTGAHPGLPVTPSQIADAAIEAAEAGAAVVHCHVREPGDGSPSRRVELYREVVESIRGRRDDVLINLTTGMGGDLVVGPSGAADTPAPGTDFVGPEERLAHVAELRPEICTLDCGSMDFDDDSLVYIAPPSYLRECMRMIREFGVKPELETFDLGQVSFVGRALAADELAEPALVQFCLGVPTGAPATPQAMQAMLSHAPAGIVWSAFGLGRAQMPMVAQAALLGGNVRVGLEDNLYLEKGVLATNGELVARAREILERMGAQVASPDEVRERLGLR
ncbi:MAG: 3-keto-5-aminohexanoate cleavage protein [Actinobacteria bacterium]|nr:3-keto-5-aminohexanoate cleavage protein [Actinomycetota bacterium]